MAKPYSEDLRRRVVETIDGGATIPEAAEQCGVSISSVGRFLRLQRETGGVRAAKFGGYKEFALAAHEELVRSLIENQPDIKWWSPIKCRQLSLFIKPRDHNFDPASVAACCTCSRPLVAQGCRSRVCAHW
jgi:transposase